MIKRNKIIKACFFLIYMAFSVLLAGDDNIDIKKMYGYNIYKCLRSEIKHEWKEDKNGFGDFITLSPCRIEKKLKVECLIDKEAGLKLLKDNKIIATWSPGRSYEIYKVEGCEVTLRFWIDNNNLPPLTHLQGSYESYLLILDEKGEIASMFQL